MKNELLKELNADLELNALNLQDKIYEIPKLYGKWQNIYFSYKIKLNKAEKQLDQLYRDIYYKLKDGDRLLENQKEIQFNILADPEYSKLNLEVRTLKDLVNIIEGSVKRIQNLSFDVKSAIDYMKFINGG